MEKLNGQSMNLTENNIDNLKQIFPEVFTEGKIDFDKLKLVLGESIEANDERYEFRWNGKGNAIKIAQTPSMGTLRPDFDSSKNWDNTENLYIEGDNLEVLKLLQKSYFGKVKMIYIDPPYNTGKDFVYKDNFRDNIANYKEMTNQTTKANPETNGRYHTDWLNMMYPRLKLARNLLREDGSIFISIDSNEMANLKKVCDEVFGEINYMGEFIWSGGRKNDSKYISTSHEFVLCYVKDISNLVNNKVIWRERKEGLDEIYNIVEKLKIKHRDKFPEITKELKEWYKNLAENHPSKQHSHYNTVDEIGVYFPSDISWPGGGGPIYNVYHPVTKQEVKIPSRGWLFTKERMEEMLKLNRVHFGEDETKVPCYKRYLNETEYQVPYSTFYQDSRGAMKRLRDLLQGKVFDFPKDEIIIKKFIKMITEDDDLVLDFFSGSCTTAHAVMQLNSEDTGNRKFIMVQLPETTDEKSEAYKAGYKNICEIGKERIRRAGEKVVSESGKADLDTGFKVFKLDDSNIKEWDANYSNLASDDIEEALKAMKDNIKEGRTKEDLLFEILIKMGIELTAPIQEVKVGDKTLFNIGMGSLIVCLEDNITEEIIKEIPKYKSKFMDMKVVFKETGFESDSLKMNAMQNLKQFGITDVRSV